MPQDQGEIRDRVKTLGDLANLIEGLPVARAGG